MKPIDAFTGKELPSILNFGRGVRTVVIDKDKNISANIIVYTGNRPGADLSAEGLAQALEKGAAYARDVLAKQEAGVPAQPQPAADSNSTAVVHTEVVAIPPPPAEPAPVQQ